MSDDLSSDIAKLLNTRIDDLQTSINTRINDAERNIGKRLDAQDVALGRVEAKVDKTNGRVTTLERGRERAQGMIAAYRWVAPLFAGAVSAGGTILVLAVTGGLH